MTRRKRGFLGLSALTPAALILAGTVIGTEPSNPIALPQSAAVGTGEYIPRELSLPMPDGKAGNRTINPSKTQSAGLTELRQDDGSFEVFYVVQDPAGPTDYFFIRYGSSQLPTPPYELAGIEIHGVDPGATTALPEAGVILAPGVTCPDPAVYAPVLTFSNPTFPPAGGGFPDSISLCITPGITVYSTGNAWIYVKMPPGSPIGEQPGIASDSSSGGNSFFSSDPTTLCTQSSGTYGLRLLVSPPPPVTVAMWSGTLASIPTGWVLCDGAPGTPDLRDRFIYGTNFGEEPGLTGGTGKHKHSVNPPKTTSGNNSSASVQRNLLPSSETSVDPHKHDINIPAFNSNSASTEVLPGHRRLAYIMTDTLTSVPTGLIGMWPNSLASIPSDWALCDGNGGRPDLQDLFVRGTITGEEPGTSVPSSLDHTHQVNPPVERSGNPSSTVNRRGLSAIFQQARATHKHDLDIPAFSSSTASSFPPYFKLAFIIYEGTGPAIPPAGFISMWAGALSAMPGDWALCDGTGGTPDLQSRFIYGTGAGEEPGATGGGDHTHSINPPAERTYSPTGTPTDKGLGAFNIPDFLNHDHNVNIPAFDSAPTTDLPPYFKLAFIMKQPDPTDVTAPDVDEMIVPSRFTLQLPTPNPFNPLTTIRMTTPKPGYVRLGVYNANGRLVRTLVDGQLDAGGFPVVWDGKDDSGSTVGSGVYFARMEAGDFRATRKMVLLR